MQRFGPVAGVVVCLVVAAPWPVGHGQSRQPTPPLDTASLLEQARTLERAGKYDEALKLAEQALAIRESELHPDDPALADALHLVAVILDHKNDYARAEPLNRRALAIREQALGPDHPDVAQSLFNLAWLAAARQDFAGAEALYARTLDIQERALGPDHRDVVTTLNDLAILFNRTGRYDEAIATNQRVIAIREAAGNEDGVALALGNLGRVYLNQGDYPTAVDTYRRSLSIWERVQGPDHPRVANAVDGLAFALSSSGDYAAAEPLFLRALAIREKTLGREHPEVGTTLTNLAGLYRNRGDFEGAVPLLLRHVAILEAHYGPDHSFLGPPLNNLALIDYQQRRYASADVRFRRALAIQERAFGREHLTVGVTLSRLGRLSLDDPSKAPAEAEAFLRRALTTLENVGTRHPEIASTLAALATLAERRGDAAEAERLLQQALGIVEQIQGPTHPAVAQTLAQMAMLRHRQADASAALDYLRRAYELRERHLTRNLPLGSDRQRVDYLTLFADDTDRAVSLHARGAPESPAALDLAVATLLRRKGRALDAASDSIATLRRHAPAEQRERFDRLAAARAQFAAVTLSGPGTASPAAYRANLERLEDTVEALEAELSAASAAFRVDSTEITSAAVQRLIPAGAALIEYARYQPRDPADGPSPAARYVAYVLTSGEATPQWADLGEAATIDAAASVWRQALRDPRRKDVATLARAVDRLVMQPLRGRLGAATHLLVSPDGPLNLLPFAALVDEEDRLLVERWTITYLTSGRDLLRLREPHPTRGHAVVVAAPAFGEPAARPSSPQSGRPRAGGARVDPAKAFFGPLPGAREEVRALRQLLPEAAFLVGREATEAALRRLSGPRLLHVATHGFFLDGDSARFAASPALAGTRLGRLAATIDNPLLRSGLALAGANQLATDGDDGILTALEASSLDLWGTRLVVLSACDTGMGDVRNGQGVYGLRRALVLAGAESQLISLWPVSDRGTRELMIGYYRHVAGGAGRGEALRQAQRDLMRTSRYAHPYYWASFIQSGAWSPLTDDEHRTRN